MKYLYYINIFILIIIFHIKLLTQTVHRVGTCVFYKMLKTVALYKQTLGSANFISANIIMIQNLKKRIVFLQLCITIIPLNSQILM